MNARRLTSTALVSLCVGACGLAFSIAAASGEMIHTYETQITGSSPAEPFGDPWGLAFNAEGQLLAADSVHSALDIFEPSNLFAPPQLVSSALSGSSATRSIAVAAGTGGVYVGSSGGPFEGYGEGSESVEVFEPEGGGKYRLLDEGHERHFHAAYGNFPYVAVDNSTDPLDERKGDVYVLAYSPTSGSVADVFVIQPNGEGELPEETAAEEESKALPAPPGGFSLDIASLPSGSGGIAVDPVTGEVYVSNPQQQVVNVFNDKGEEQPALNLDGSETPGRFTPVGIAIDSANEMVYVVNKEEHAVDQFSKTGKFLGQIKQTASEEALVEPKGVAVQEAAGPTRGDVYIANGQSIDVFGPSLVVADVRLAGASNVGKATVTLSGTVNPDEVLVSGCRFEYMSSEEPTFTHSEACSPSPGSGAVAVPVSAAIGGLTAGTTYRFRLSATNANGTSNGLGREESFKTPPAVEALSTGAATAGAKPTDETLTGSLSPDGTDAHYYFQYGTSTAYGSTSPAPPGTDAGTGGAGCEPPGGSSCSPVSAQTSLSGLESDTEYHYRLVAVDSFGTTYGEDATFTTGGPGIQEESVSDVAASSATLEATIAPKSLPTTYYFQYGASVEYGSTIPAPPGTEVNAGEASVAVNRHLDGLLAGTVYHYRAVAVSETAPGVLETFDGQDQTFTTQPPGSGFVLPDGRQWEMVTPPDKRGGNIIALIESPIQASVNGDAITYPMNLPPDAEPLGYAAEAQVLSRRGPEGWVSQDISVPHAGATGVTLGNGEEYRLFSEDLSLSIVHPFGPFDPSFSVEASERVEFLRTDYSNGNVNDPCTTSCYRPMVTRQPGYANVPPGLPLDEPGCIVVCGPRARGATPDLSHVVIRSAYGPLTVDAPGLYDDLYEWTAGKLTYIGSGQFGSSQEISARHAISNDGSRVIFDGESEGQTGLLLRDTVRGKTVRLAKDNGEFKNEFQIASSDDSRVFFTGAGLTTAAGDLFECEMVEKEGNLTCNLSNLTPAGGQVQGVLGASEDGSYVYFVALGTLAEGAVPGADNLYVRHGGVTKLIDILAATDHPDWELGELTSRVSPDGRWLTFMSDRNLTGYVTRDAVSGIPDKEVYLYDATGSEHLVCASCNPSGARPTGVFARLPGAFARFGDQWVAAGIPGSTPFEGAGRSRYQSRVLSDSGRLFFDSSDALAPQDVNGAIDVYEYEPPSVGSCNRSSVTFSERSGGCIALISSGTSAEESEFLDASGSGGDVFFMTEAKLSFKDVDTSFDVYDAHECRAGSPCFPVQAAPPPPCDTGDACKPSPTPQPAIFGTPSSATFSGAGNIVPSAPPSAVKPKAKESTQARKRARALRACRRKRGKGRAMCERRARARYAMKESRKANATKKGRG